MGFPENISSLTVPGDPDKLDFTRFSGYKFRSSNSKRAYRSSAPKALTEFKSALVSKGSSPERDEAPIVVKAPDPVDLCLKTPLIRPTNRFLIFSIKATSRRVNKTIRGSKPVLFSIIAVAFVYFASKTATVGSDVVQSGRPIFEDFFQHLWPYIGNNTANVVFQMVKRLWLIRIDQ
ncbi:hypothetical protein TNCV_1069911 [Trichonephila clavipes]|nr:hypothetical protein TNCV_1069911 [Trichonephila clavipes]